MSTTAGSNSFETYARRRALGFRALLLSALILVVGACDRAKSSLDDKRDLVAERKEHRTKLKRTMPSPQEFEQITLAAPVRAITYPSGDLQLKAWISAAPTDGQKYPAVVFCHGGFAFGDADWTEDAARYAEAGFVVMAPTWRGENGNPGGFELFFGEVDDALAAGRFLAQQQGVDAQRVFVAGHSAGATIALLSAMVDGPFAAAAPIGAPLDMHKMVDDPDWTPVIVFDAKDEREIELRSPLFFASSLRVPTMLLIGDQDPSAGDHQTFRQLAESFQKTCTVEVIPGDHMSSKPAAIQKSIEFFKSVEAKR